MSDPAAVKHFPPHIFLVGGESFHHKTFQEVLGKVSLQLVTILKYERGRALSEAVLTAAPEIVSVVVVDLNLTVRVSSLIQLTVHLCNAGGHTCEALDRQRAMVGSLEFLNEDPSVRMALSGLK